MKLCHLARLVFDLVKILSDHLSGLSSSVYDNKEAV
jgi:hypothetical protein